MSNTIPKCPRCNAFGNVIYHRKNHVTLECPICKEKWSTPSEICPDCQEPNGFAVKGPCSKCYVERYKSS